MEFLTAVMQSVMDERYELAALNLLHAGTKTSLESHAALEATPESADHLRLEYKALRTLGDQMAWCGMALLTMASPEHEMAKVAQENHGAFPPPTLEVYGSYWNGVITGCVEEREDAMNALQVATFLTGLFEEASENAGPFSGATMAFLKELDRAYTAVYG